MHKIGVFTFYFSFKIKIIIPMKSIIWKPIRIYLIRLFRNSSIQHISKSLRNTMKKQFKGDWAVFIWKGDLREFCTYIFERFNVWARIFVWQKFSCRLWPGSIVRKLAALFDRRIECAISPIIWFFKLIVAILTSIRKVEMHL